MVPFGLLQEESTAQEKLWENRGNKRKTLGRNLPHPRSVWWGASRRICGKKKRTQIWRGANCSIPASRRRAPACSLPQQCCASPLAGRPWVAAVRHEEHPCQGSWLVWQPDLGPAQTSMLLRCQAQQLRRWMLNDSDSNKLWHLSQEISNSHLASLSPSYHQEQHASLHPYPLKREKFTCLIRARIVQNLGRAAEIKIK